MLEMKELLLICLFICLFLNVMRINKVLQNSSSKSYTHQCTQCQSMVPCFYKDEVVLRVIVLTYNRKDSLSKCLEALQQADIMGVEAALEIWIDLSKDGQVDIEVLNLAQSFEWRHGRTCVHVQTRHVNVAFQWIYSWRPKAGSREIGVFIEDDVDVSKYFFWYLKKAKDFYSGYKDIGGICLNDEGCQIVQGSNRGKLLIRPTGKTDNVFLYGLFCTWGYAPFPDHWRAFQDWYHNNVSLITDFDPTAKEAELQSLWFKKAKEQGTTDTMLHEMYIIRYSIDHQLFTLHPNLQVFQPRPQSSLTSNRKERGLHSAGLKNITDHRLNVWDESFAQFPKRPMKFYWNGVLN